MQKEFYKRINHPVTLITIAYIVVGSLWILFSDRAVVIFFNDAETITLVQTFKGWFYVFGSGLLIYSLMSWVVQILREKEHDLYQKDIRHREFLNRHYQALWQSNDQGHCVFNNEKWADLTGENLPTDRPFAWLDRVHPDDKPYCIDKFTQGYISQSFFELEYRIKVKDGEYHWVNNTCSPVLNSHDQFAGFMGFYIDIQEKKLLQERYKESSRRYGYLFANNPNPMLVYDTQDFRILEANKAAQSLYGYGEKELLSLSLIDLRPPSEIPVFMNHVSEALPEFHRSSGWLHKRKDGTVFDAEVTAHSLPLTQTGRVLRLVIIRDITEQIRAFRSAKEGDRRFRAIFNHSPQGTVICNNQFEIIDINPSACIILETTPETSKGTSLSSFIYNSYDFSPFTFLDNLSISVPLTGEVSMVRSNGVSFRSSYNAIRFQENNHDHYYYTFNDIDENYKMQIALQESERINATLVSNLPGMVYRRRYDRSWTMTFVSFGVEKLTGYHPPELLHNNIISYEELIHPDDKGWVIELVGKALHEKENFDMQYRIINRQGMVKWVWEQAGGIFSEDGSLLYVEGYIMDITREKEAGNALEFQTYFLRLIIDNIPFPLFYKDVNGVYMGCNNDFCQYLDLEKEKIEGHSVFDIFEVTQAAFFHEKDMVLLKTGGSQNYETEIVFPDGRKMDAVFHKSVFYDKEQKPLGIIGIYFDITQRVQAEKVIKKQLEELGRINSELERFSYTVSHDLRSPLVTIKGFLGLMREDMADNNHEQIEEDMQRIESATDKMQQLLEDLLKLSRLGKVVDQNEKFSMSTAANEAHELLHGLMREKKCIIDIQQDMPQVLAGKARIRELFQNLLENAVKFSKLTDSPEIKVYARKEQGNDVFCVQDNGIGIEPRYHDKVFGLFNKLDASSPGTGLGLSLVKRIVENHKGRIWIESDGNNEGTIFCFTINSENPNE